MIYTEAYFADQELRHSSPWTDENGNNTPAYNHKYWVEHKQEIMARRRFLQAGADSESGKYSGQAADNYLAFLERSVNDYMMENRDRLTQEEQKLLLDEYHQEVDRVNANRGENRQVGTKHGTPKEDTKEESKGNDKSSSKTSSSNSSSNSKDSSKSSSKSSSGSSSDSSSSSGSSKKSSGSSKSSGGSSSKGSSSKSSSGSGKSSSKSGGAVTPRFDPVKSGAKASKDSSKSSKEGSSKEKSGSGKSSSGSKSSSDKSSKSNSKETKNQQPSEDNSPESVAFSKIKESGYEPGNEPTNSYASFIREIRERTNYEVNDAETGLALWREYRKRRGMDTSDALIAKHRADAEKDIANRKSMKHGMDLFDYYTADDDIRHNADLFDSYIDSLEHHGIMGMRWGVQNGPPYPLKDGAHNASERKAGWQQSLSAAGRKLRGLSGDAGTAIKKAAKNTSAEIHKRREASKAKKAEREEAERRAEQERRDAERRSAISRGDSKYAEENFEDMSDAEINALLNRNSLKSRVDAAAGIKDPETFDEKVDTIFKKVKTYRSWAEEGINTYNTAAKIYNSFNEDKLPTIDGDLSKRLKDEKKAEREKWFKDVSKDPAQIQKYLDKNEFNADEMQTLANMTKNRTNVRNNLNPNANVATASGRISDLKDSFIFRDKDASKKSAREFMKTARSDSDFEFKKEDEQSIKDIYNYIDTDAWDKAQDELDKLEARHSAIDLFDSYLSMIGG